MRNKLRTLSLGAGLALALGLRLWRFDSITPLTSDEAGYLRQARLFYTVAGLALGRNMPEVDPSARGVWRYARRSDWDCKPCWLHSALVAAWMPLTGVNTAAGSLHSLIFSMATVVLLYFTGRALYGRDGAIFASVLLGLSFYWMWYSRGHWAEVDATFFVLLGFHIVLTRFPREELGLPTAFAAGVAAAAGGLCHYRFLTAALPLGCSALLLADRQSLVVRTAVLALGYAAALLAFDGAMRLALLLTKSDMPFGGYLAAVREIYFPVRGSIRSQTAFAPLNAVAFLWYYGRNLGVAACLLAMVGLFPWAWQTGNGRLVLAVASFVVLPLVLFVFQVWVVARGASLTIPFVCLLSGWGMDAVLRSGWESVGLRRVARYAAAAALAALMLAENLPRDARLASNQMGHERVAQALAKAKPERIYVDPESVHFYAWHEPDLPYVSDRTLRAALESGASLDGAWAVFDAEKYHAYPERWESLGLLEQTVRERAVKIVEEPNMTTAWRDFLLEGTQAHTLAGMLDSLRRAQGTDITSIRAYRLLR